MIKQLTEQEYNLALDTYGVSHFMGGARGIDETATIYLYEDKITLVSHDEVEEIKRIESIQRKEADEYFDQIKDRL